MKILNKENINEIVSAVKKGKVLVFPTETSYGLGCDATNQESVDKIFKIKKRSNSKSLLVVVDSIKEAKKYLKWSGVLEKISQRYWPGSLTVVSDSCLNNNLSVGVAGEDNTLALRVGEDDFLKEICHNLDYPLVATSANIAGEGNIYKFEEIKKVFDKEDVVLVDGGNLQVVPSTTIIKIKDEKLTVLRQGSLKIDLKNI